MSDGYILMNTDTPVLMFTPEIDFIEVLDNGFLPYMLKDYIVSSSKAPDIRKAIRDTVAVRDFLVSRTLNLSRDNAKVILNAASLPQSLKTEEKLKIVYACRALNMEDNFWLAIPDEELKFSDVCLRNNKLSEVSYDIAILGRHISATRDELVPDLMSGGMFPKYWHRGEDGIELWKTDSVTGEYSKCEVAASLYITEAGGKCVQYWREDKDGKAFSVCKCFTDDARSLVKATDVRDWCIHTGQELTSVTGMFHDEFADMVIADYVLGNTDRHMDNWGFMVDNTTNAIISFAPLYDLNQALAGDIFGTRGDFDEMIYEPLGTTFCEAAVSYSTESRLDFDNMKLPDGAAERWNKVKELRREKGTPVYGNQDAQTIKTNGDNDWDDKLS